MSRLNHYKAALYLTAAIALMEAIWILFFIIPRMPEHTKGFSIPLITTVITLLGLLIHSNLFRYIGAVFMLIWAGALLWPLVSSGVGPLSRPIIFLYYSFSGALNLLAAAILLFSKQFSYEFAKRRSSESKYMGNLRLLLIGVIVAAALLATINDIVNLASAP